MDKISYTAFWDELEKIAQEPVVEDPAIKRRRLIGRLAGGAGGMMGAGAVGSIAGQALGSSLLKDVAANPQTTTHERVRGLVKEVAPGAEYHLIEPRTVDFGYGPARIGGGNISQAMHIPKGGTMPNVLRDMEKAHYLGRGIPHEVIEKGFQHGVSVAPSAAGSHIAAHELGHAALRQHAIGRAIAHLRSPAALIGGLAAPTMAIAAKDPDSTMAKAAPLVGLAGIAPTLADEAYASFKGYGGMKRLGVPAGELATGRRQLAKAFRTYALPLAAGSVLAPYAIRKIRSAIQKRHQAQEGVPA